MLAVTHARIIDGSGRDPIADGVILIDGGRITQVGPARAVARPKDAGYPAGPAIPPVHNRSIHLLRVGGSEDTAPAGIEQGIVLERHDSHGYRLEGAAASRQDIATGRQRAAQALMV